MDGVLITACVSGIGLLLLLILWLRLHAFLSLLIASIWVGLIAGMPPAGILASIQEGMASTLGFVALIIGLGAIFGSILEHSGGAMSIANYTLEKSGLANAPLAMCIAGFVIAIPVFFDVAFIILIPVIYALQRRTGKSLLLYAMPLLAGLAVTHAFIPPTPGPVAVSEIIGADLGWVIGMGILCAIPASLAGGVYFGRFISGKIYLKAPESPARPDAVNFPPVLLVFLIILLPIVLIVAATFMRQVKPPETGSLQLLYDSVQLVGHPFTALIIANLLAWYVLGIKRGFNRKQLMKISSASMSPAGLIILLTGAGGVFKQILIDTGAGEMLARYFADIGLAAIVFAFISAALVRILQGSATVAMITAAGLCSPILGQDMGQAEKSLIVLAIAAGASILSHVNDSGFWLVSKYLGMNEKETFRSWTAMTCIISLTGFAMVILLSFLI